MSGFAKGGVAIIDGGNVAIAGIKPSGIAAQGNVIYKASSAIVEWLLLTHTATSGSNFSTAPINTIGANLIVIFATYWNSYGSVSDNQGNTWTNGPSIIGPSGAAHIIRYCINPSTSATHTFSTPQSYAALAIQAFQKSPAITEDQSTTNTSSSAITVQVGPITPSANDALIVSGAGSNNYTAQSIDSGFTLTDITPQGSNETIAAAYLIQAMAAAIAPTWTFNGMGSCATLLSFVASPWTLLASVTTIQPATTSAAIDTSGATLLVVVSTSDSTDTPILVDSLSNSWSNQFAINANSSGQSRIFYCGTPKAGTAHTFTVSGSTYAGFIVMAFKGPASTSSVDLFNSATLVGQGTTIQVSLTPTSANSLIITGVNSSGNISSIDSGFTIAGNVPYTSGVIFGGAAAYRVQTVAAAIAPIWNIPLSVGAVATILSFMPTSVMAGLIDYWPMNEGAGNTFNNAVNPSNPMTASNITWATNTGFTGGPTPQFNESTSGAVSAQNSTLDGPFTLCIAVIMTANPNGSIMLRSLSGPIGSLVGCQMYIDSTNDVKGDLSNGAPYIEVATQGGLVTINTAHYICLTYDGSGKAAGMNCYIDGVLRPVTVVSDTFSGSFLSNIPFRVGSDGSTTTYTLTGTLANARIYNRVLTASEVATLSSTMGK